MPSEHELVRQYGVSRTTVRRALERLAEEGGIVRRRGSGTFARLPPEQDAHSLRRMRLLDDRRVAAAGVTSRLVAFKHIPTPAFLMRQWPEFGEASLFIRRTSAFDGKPFELSTIYVTEVPGQLITRRKLGHDPVLVVLDSMGYTGRVSEQTTSALASDSYSTRQLGTPIGTPLLTVRQLVRDGRGRILLYQECAYRPDRYEVRLTARRADAPTRRPSEEQGES